MPLHYLLALLSCCLLTNLIAQEDGRDTLLIDFGTEVSPAPWNNLTDAGSGSITNLLNARGNPSGYGIAVSDSFNNVNTAGTREPATALGLPATATGDSFFGNTALFGGQTQPTGAVDLTGLRPEKEYDIVLFASRTATDNREARYLVTGATQDTLLLDAASNTDRTVITTVYPAADSTVRIVAMPGPNNTNASGFYYLGALIVSYTEETTMPLPSPTDPEDVLDTVLVDFGGTTTSPPPYNNITDPRAGSVPDLLNTSGFSTGYAIAVVDSFNNINTDGTVNPAAALDLLATATGDSFFGNIAPFGGQTQPTGAVALTGLDTAQQYTVEVFASRTATDNRETQYTVTGSGSDTLFLNVSSNADRTVTTTLQPDSSGTIRIEARPGPNNNNGSNFYYLGALRLTYPNTAPAGGATLTLTDPNGGERWQVGRTADITWTSRNVTDVVLEYTTDDGNNWSAIDTVVAAGGRYPWTIPNTPTEEARVRIIADTLLDESDGVFTITTDTTTCTIVVLGSSTAEGTGASTPDSAWVNRFRASLANDTRFEVVNLARGGYTTYHILPTGAEIPAGVNITPDPERNITHALTYDPFAIIVNMPSNDAANNFSVSAQLDNFAAVTTAAGSQDAEVYVATTQPRNFTDPAQIALQREVRDSILAIYGDRSIDFWTGLATENGFIRPEYDSGDGIHLNDAGHAILFRRVAELELGSTNCAGPTSLRREPVRTERGLLSVFPNPTTTGYLNLTFSRPLGGAAEVRLYDALGREHLRRQLPEGQTAGVYRLDLAGLARAPGTYYCTVTVRTAAGWVRDGVLLVVR